MIEFNAAPEFYHGYLKQIESGSVVENLISSEEKMKKLFDSIPEDKGDYAYEDGKWSIKELILHMIDAERVFTYRSHRFGRGDNTDLSGFEQDDYVPVSNANARTLGSLKNEFEAVRVATLSLYSTFDESNMSQKGTVNGNEFSVEAIGYITVGHMLHHIKVIEERYLNGH